MGFKGFLAVLAAVLCACSSSNVVVPKERTDPFDRSASPDCTVPGEWTFQGACKSVVMEQDGISVRLAAYKGLAVRAGFESNNAQPDTRFVVAEGTGARDITGTVSGKAFPFYGQPQCVTLRGYNVPCRGKAFLYLLVANASDVEVFFSGIGPFLITNDNGFPGSTCSISQLATLHGKIVWQDLQMNARIQNGGKTLRFAHSQAVLPVYTAKMANVLAFVCNHVPAENDLGGKYPSSGLLDVEGLLYGTTSAGGAHGAGTIFSVKPAGTEAVLYDFRSQHGGYAAAPSGGLISVAKTFYGVTESGGMFGKGSAFSLSPTGSLTALYSFGSGKDGATPAAPLSYAGGTFYGVTGSGGLYGEGTVFSLTPAGSEKVLHDFGQGYNSGTDGESPNGGLLDVNGTFYGTTYFGGYHPFSGSHGYGTVFSVTADGTETVLYKFGTYKHDGQYPVTPLIEVGGNLYGMTRRGGDHGFGTVFAITPSGTEKVIYSFHGSDGEYPAGPLVNLDGVLYGVTSAGGPTIYGFGGTVFSITPAGALRVLHEFGRDFYDGKFPESPLTLLHGTLYGTTRRGGQYDVGTVYSITKGGVEKTLYTFGSPK